MLEQVTKLVAQNASEHQFSLQQRELDQVAKELKLLVITDKDSHRTCFLKALQLAERLTAVKTFVENEINAKYEVSTEMAIFKKRQESFDSKKVVYEELLVKLQMYPTTVLNGINTYMLFTGLIEQATDLIQNLQQKVNSTNAGKYGDAVLRTERINDIVKKIDGCLVKAKGVIDELALKEKSYQAVFVETDNLVTRAEREVKDSDVKNSTVKLARDARALLEEVVRLRGLSKVDWILLDKKMQNAQEEAQKAITEAANDIVSAGVYRSSNVTYYASKTTSDWPAPSSYTSGGFGGFGGGSFGGGGGGSSW